VRCLKECECVDAMELAELEQLEAATVDAPGSGAHQVAWKVIPHLLPRNSAAADAKVPTCDERLSASERNALDCCQLRL
jgi:hypothetical protein